MIHGQELVYPRSAHIIDWLYRLDTYTNAEFGVARTLALSEGVCVACLARVIERDKRGLCSRCSAKRVADRSEVVLFRPLRRRPV